MKNMRQLIAYHESLAHAAAKKQDGVSQLKEIYQKLPLAQGNHVITRYEQSLKSISNPLSFFSGASGVASQKSMHGIGDHSTATSTKAKTRVAQQLSVPKGQPAKFVGGASTSSHAVHSSD